MHSEKKLQDQVEALKNDRDKRIMDHQDTLEKEK